MLKLYADQPALRLWTATKDAAVLVWITLWAAAGVITHHLVLSLQRLSDGLAAAGRSIDQVIEAFRSAVPQNLPLVGQFFYQLTTSLERVSGRQLIAWGNQAHDDIARMALGLGLFVALPPILLVGGWHLRRRLQEARERSAAAAFLAAARASRRSDLAAALLAHRAVATLSFRQLMLVSPDPVGDVEAGRHRALAVALLSSLGLGSERLDPAPERLDRATL